MRILIATKNPGKLREIRAILAGADVAPPPPEWQPPPEDGADYLQNAFGKARALVAASGIASIADDSGIEVDALDGAPGMRSARYAGEQATDADNLGLLLKQLADVPDDARGARFRCVAVFVSPEGREAHTEGVVEGHLIREPRGKGGFGYDPIFVPNGHELTTAELPADEKDRISHRGIALRALAKKIDEMFGGASGGT